MLMMAGGTVWQASCADTASATIASSIAELASSITAEYIRSVVEQALNISTGFSF